MFFNDILKYQLPSQVKPPNNGSGFLQKRRLTRTPESPKQIAVQGENPVHSVYPPSEINKNIRLKVSF